MAQDADQLSPEVRSALLQTERVFPLPTDQLAPDQRTSPEKNDEGSGLGPDLSASQFAVSFRLECVDLTLFDLDDVTQAALCATLSDNLNLAPSQVVLERAFVGVSAQAEGLQDAGGRAADSGSLVVDINVVGLADSAAAEELRWMLQDREKYGGVVNEDLFGRSTVRQFIVRSPADQKDHVKARVEALNRHQDQQQALQRARQEAKELQELHVGPLTLATTAEVAAGAVSRFTRALAVSEQLGSGLSIGQLTKKAEDSSSTAPATKPKQPTTNHRVAAALGEVLALQRAAKEGEEELRKAEADAEAAKATEAAAKEAAIAAAKAAQEAAAVRKEAGKPEDDPAATEPEAEGTAEKLPEAVPTHVENPEEIYGPFGWRQDYGPYVNDAQAEHLRSMAIRDYEASLIQKQHQTLAADAPPLGATLEKCGLARKEHTLRGLGVSTAADLQFVTDEELQSPTGPGLTKGEVSALRGLC